MRKKARICAAIGSGLVKGTSVFTCQFVHGPSRRSERAVRPNTRTPAATVHDERHLAASARGCVQLSELGAGGGRQAQGLRAELKERQNYNIRTLLFHVM